VNQPSQRTVSGTQNFVAVELGGEHSCAIRVNGTLACWGENDQRQLGFVGDPVSTPTLSPLLDNLRVVSGGGDTTCGFGRRTPPAPTVQGVLCWGRNEFGQTGGAPSATPATNFVVPAPDAPQVETGFQFACAMAEPGVPSCWGRNTSGQMGRGTTTTSQTQAPVSSFAVNLAPVGSLENSGRKVAITVLAVCAAGARAKVEVSANQGDVFATGKGDAECEGAVVAIPVELQARAGLGFLPGPVQARAVAVIRDGGDVIDTQEWSRVVELIE
jgi:hypothetical protein